MNKLDFALGRLKYFLEAWEYNGIGRQIVSVTDSPNSYVAIDVEDLQLVLDAATNWNENK